MAKLHDVIKSAKPLERTVFLCVAGDIAGEYEEKSRRLLDLTEGSGGRLSGAPAGVKELQAEVDALSDKMVENTYAFKLRALSAHKFSNLMAEHPDEKGERAFDIDTFLPALISACCYEPEGMDDPEQAKALFDVISPAQQGELSDAAWDVHQTAPKGLTS